MSAILYTKTKNVAISSGASRGGNDFHRPRIARRSYEDGPAMDFSKDPKSIVDKILKNIVGKGIGNDRRLFYLNEFVKYIRHVEAESSGTDDLSRRNLGYSMENLLLCLRVCLVNEATVIRLASLRVLRYLLSEEQDLIIMNSVHIPHLIVRSLDVVLNNSAERQQATRLCQKILAIPNGAKHFPSAITRSLVAIGFDGQSERDRLFYVSLSILCQLALLNPMQFIECGGVRVLLHNILGFESPYSPMILESMIGSLLHLLNVPETRDAAGVNLQSLVAPFTDVHFKHGAQESSNKNKTIDERENGYQCAKIAIGTVLRSWSGIAHFCQSKNSGLQALIDALYIEQLEIRRTILDLICDILGVKFPTWSDEVTVALSAVDPSSPLESWKLQEGFIVQETLSVLPHLAVATPSITKNHMALVVLSFIRRGLLEALVDVIVTGDTFISVRGTVLLGELLSLVDKYIPLDCYDPSQCIPTLIRYSAGDFLDSDSPTKLNSKPSSQSSFASAITPQFKQQRALEAINVLTTLQKLKAKPASPCSVFLQAQLVYAGYIPKQDGRFSNKLGQVQVIRLLQRDVESNPSKLLKDSVVLNYKDSTMWNWDIIMSLIKWSPSPLRRVDDASWRNFLKRLVDFFKPSNNLFARIELGKGPSKLLSKAACTFVEFLAEDVENFSGVVYLEELLVDIATHLDEVLRESENPHKCFFSPIKLETTLSQTYFLLIGKLTHSVKGYRILEKGDILKRFHAIVREVENDDYIKLIISSLSYREDYCKRILVSALTCKFDGSRLFATQFLRILVRIKLSGFSKWGIELLVNRLADSNKIISLAAVDILEEAIHDKMFLESLIALRPSLSHLGDRGYLLLINFLSLPSGFKYLLESGILRKEIVWWKNNFNKRYVEVVEVLVRDSVSSLRRGEDGKYPERTSQDQSTPKFQDIFVPPHLYGQLVHHKEGLELLLEDGDIDGLIQIVNKKNCKTPEDTKELKSALWALAHFSTSVETVSLLENSRVFENMVEIGRFCPVLSVRHTVFHCLCLICVTVPGIEALRKFGWYGMPRNHHENFTVWTPEYFESVTQKYIQQRLEAELDEDEGDKTSIVDSSSNVLLEEEKDLDMDDCGECKEYSEQNPFFVPRTSSTTSNNNVNPKWSYSHQRSQSESQTRSTSTSEVQHLADKLSDAINLSNSGYTPNEDSKIRHPRSNSLSESSHSEVYSESPGSGTKLGQSVVDHVQTLSPIPSSASIDTTLYSSSQTTEHQSPPSRGSSRGTITEPTFNRYSFGSPGHVAYRSMKIRKPLIRMPILSDPEFGILSGRRGSASYYERKAGSLDRHIMLSPGDLFVESKIMRVNSSITSLSTPSFRIRPESETKGPCYMGLCVPDDFQAIFLTDSSIPLHVRMTSMIDDLSAPENLRESFELKHRSHCMCSCSVDEETESENVTGFKDKMEDAEESSVDLEDQDSSDNLFLRLLNVDLISSVEKINPEKRIPSKSLCRKVVLTLVSDMICCVGAKSNEQGLLRLKQKVPQVFQDICLYYEVCRIMSKYNIRLILRRFLQEIFYDMPFTEFYNVAHAIVNQQNVTSPQE